MIEIYDRGIYEILRLRLVELGYIPDITLHDRASYSTARSEIITNKKINIELYGVGSGISRKEKVANRITINRVGLDTSLKNFGAIDYIKNGDNYTKELLPGARCNISYDIRIICDSIKNERLLLNVVNTSLSYYKFINILDKDVFIERVSISNLNYESTIEYSFNYILRDVFIEESMNIGSISEIKTIKDILNV